MTYRDKVEEIFAPMDDTERLVGDAMRQLRALEERVPGYDPADSSKLRQALEDLSLVMGERLSMALRAVDKADDEIADLTEEAEKQRIEMESPARFNDVCEARSLPQDGALMLLEDLPRDAARHLQSGGDLYRAKRAVALEWLVE